MSEWEAPRWWPCSHTPKSPNTHRAPSRCLSVTQAPPSSHRLLFHGLHFSVPELDTNGITQQVAFCVCSFGSAECYRGLFVLSCASGAPSYLGTAWSLHPPVGGIWIVSTLGLLGIKFIKAMKFANRSLCGHVHPFLSGRFLEALLGHVASACSSETSVFFSKWLQDLLSHQPCMRVFFHPPSRWLCIPGTHCSFNVHFPDDS